LNGFHGDLNETYLVGKCNKRSIDLVTTTYQSLEAAIAMCKPGVMYREVGNLISNIVEPKGYAVVRSYTGHGIGKIFHCAPNVPHYRNNKAVGFMKVGHVFTIEPMINEGNHKDFTWKDNWTSSTTDGQRSA
jgi:methionyl aminopeptidase